MMKTQEAIISSLNSWFPKNPDRTMRILGSAKQIANQSQFCSIDIDDSRVDLTQMVKALPSKAEIVTARIQEDMRNSSLKEIKEIAKLNERKEGKPEIKISSETVYKSTSLGLKEVNWIGRPGVSNLISRKYVIQSELGHNLNDKKTYRTKSLPAFSANRLDSACVSQTTLLEEIL